MEECSLDKGKVKSHSFHLGTSCFWFWLPCWPGMKAPSFAEVFLMWWNQKADILAYGSCLWSSHSVVEGRGRKIAFWEHRSSPCVWPTSEILTSKPAQSHNLVCGHQCAKTQPFLDFIHRTQLLWLKFTFVCVCAMFKILCSLTSLPFCPRTKRLHVGWKWKPRKPGIWK